MILVKNLIKDYAEDGSLTRALGGVSFEIKKGEFVAVMGPSGSGKSTLLHILSFLDRPTSGSYTFLGKGINEMNDEELARVRNKKMGFVFQAFNLISNSSVFENVELPLLYAHILPKDREKKVIQAVKAVGLAGKISVEAGKISGGEKQRIAIARALVNDPEIVFADEPTGNLDSKSGAQVMEVLEKLHDAGRTIILVTHETYTSEYAHRLIKLQDGLIVSDAPVVKKHRHGAKGEFFK